jgi:hypothetical protein
MNMVTKAPGQISYDLKCSYCEQKWHSEYKFLTGFELPEPHFPLGWLFLSDGYGTVSVICPKHDILVDKGIVSPGEASKPKTKPEPDPYGHIVAVLSHE